MQVSNIILWFVCAGILLGGIDYILGNKFGLGREFEEGLKTLGPLALAMIGAISLAPVAARIIGPIATPLLGLFGADPSLAASVIAIDMGGYPLAQALAHSTQAAIFSGLIVASMLGATLIFSIPVALGIIKPEDRIFFLKGLLAGIITIPIGAFVGGFAAHIPMPELLADTLPIAIISIIVTASLWLFPRITLKFTEFFSKIIAAIIVVGLIAASIQALTGFAIISGMAPVTEGIKTVGLIAIVLMGAFPLVTMGTRLLRRPLLSFGKVLRIDENSVSGILASLVNNIPMWHMFAAMDERGKIVNAAFMVSGAFTFGDHLGFVAGVDPSMIACVILAKITSASCSIPAAIILAKRTQKITKI